MSGRANLLGEPQVTLSVERYRRRAMLGREEEVRGVKWSLSFGTNSFSSMDCRPLTTYHVPAAPNAMAKATPRAKISELQPTPRPPIRRPRLAPVLERLRGRRVTSYCVFIPVTVSSLHGPTAFSSTSISCIFVSLSHVGVGVHLHAFPYVYDGSAQPIMSDSSESVLPPAYADSQASAFEQSICPPPYGPRLLSRPSTVTSALSPIQSLRLASSLVDLAAPYDDDPTPDPIVPPNDACFWIRT
ncbi:uncharacterized protein B0H18DRAFT_1121787 [Fomitopsis serialis]|uniref:uncharacterized protein n=1 Tax=Fomitopsis serialis TaxID=139415 RepID=UPI002007CE48|nr:uncharacterized protein B0H18DRAFT_1121787 [Neoantrodia serialis]KAH9920695.1 hypothetical protein B0H18DRAFT_1121787 [Neoantrodia serialis]